MVVMGFFFAIWVEGLDFGLRFPAKTILAGNLACNHKREPKIRQSYQQTRKKKLTNVQCRSCTPVFFLGLVCVNR